MLTYLRVFDFALIEDAEVEFRGGLNVLTGETGAGKTVLIGAIGLLLGDRADATNVRDGAEEARLSCAFDLSAREGIRCALADSGWLDEGETELMLGRVVPRGGKGRCTINGRIAPVSALGEIGGLLVDIHGQNTHQQLLGTRAHLECLDRFAGDLHLEVLAEYREHYGRLRALEKEMDELSDAVGLQREEEILRSDIERIDRAALEPGQLEELETEAERLRHGRELFEMGSNARDALDADGGVSPSVVSMLSAAREDVKGMSSRDGNLSALLGRVESLYFEAEDVAKDISAYLAALDAEPGRLDEVESRLSVIRNLLRMYGGSMEEIRSYRGRAAEKLAGIKRARERSMEIDRLFEEELSTVERLAEELSRARAGAAGKLEKAVKHEMGELELSGASFHVALDGGGNGKETPLGPSGRDEVEFLFSAEPGGTPKPLRKIASGGEMSRVMLALKIVLAGADRVPVLIFDEVDSGIGGETAGRVGEKLFVLTSFHQVFCVTHIPQIATFADWQYAVSRERSGGAGTSVSLLEGNARLDEMCRMLGDTSGRKVTREHATDILRRAEKKKHGA